jgi:hypothetical protein
MTRQAWLSEVTHLIARVAKIDPLQAEFHPAYRAALGKIDRLIEHGLQHEYLTPEEAARF